MTILSLRKPVVYDGPADEEAIHETFMQWREPCQQDLTDTNFEHLTQASVEFYGFSCLFDETIKLLIYSVNSIQIQILNITLSTLTNSEEVWLCRVQ